MSNKTTNRKADMIPTLIMGVYILAACFMFFGVAIQLSTYVARRNFRRSAIVVSMLPVFVLALVLNPVTTIVPIFAWLIITILLFIEEKTNSK